MEQYAPYKTASSLHGASGQGYGGDGADLSPPPATYGDHTATLYSGTTHSLATITYSLGADAGATNGAGVVIGSSSQ